MTPILRAALALTAALSLAACEQKPDDAFGQKVRAYLLEHPEVLEEAIGKLQEKKLAQAADIAKASLVKHRAALERDPRDFVANPNGSITVVEFFDYNCGYCKIAAPDVVKLVAENPDVRFVFKEFAFQTEDSIIAGKIALTPAAKAKGLPLYAALMAQKPLDQAAIDRSLIAVGVDPDVARQQANDPAIEKHLRDIHAPAGELKIDGTPAFIVGDTVVSGADMTKLRAAIAAAKAGKLKTPPDVNPT
jgi:protein-disulfide isomerase